MKLHRSGPATDRTLEEPTPTDEPEARAPGLKPPLLSRLRGGRDTDPGYDFDEPDGEGFGPHGPSRRGWRRLLHPFVLVVILPTILAMAFEYLVAADQYESEVQFMVRAPQPSVPVSGLSQMLGFNPGPVQADGHSVNAYLLSHDALDALGRNRLVAMFRRPEADPVTRLWTGDPQPETLLKYYRSMVHVSNSSETGITTLTVRGFRQGDALALAESLLRLGEARVNSLNQRMLEDGLRASKRQVQEAEALVEKTQATVTSFRQARRDVDPERTGTAQIELAATLQQQAAQARASFEAMAGKISPAAPQYAATQRRVAALERQVAAAQARLAGSERSIAGNLGEYEELQVRQQFAAKQYEAAAAGYQAAREQLLKQQLFIVPVVKPNLPGKALYPKRLSTVALVFFILLWAYAIGWLILAGVREHAE